MPHTLDNLRRENALAVAATLTDYLAEGGEARFVSTEDPSPLSIQFTMVDAARFRALLAPHLARVVDTIDGGTVEARRRN